MADDRCDAQCPNCHQADLVQEHAHGRCPSCGYRGACCW